MARFYGDGMTKTTQPRVSVLMPAYNAADFIVPAIASILAQEFTAFRLIILNDGSTDDTAQIINSFALLDKRIQVLVNIEKTGILAARDRLLAAVETEYFAWMDADDISTPDRLRKQVSFLDQNPDIDAVGGAWTILGTDRVTTPYRDPEELKAAMLVSNPFHNPVMMLRSTSAKALSFRFVDCGVKSASDFAFVTLLNQSGRFSTLSDVLYLYRVHPSQESTANAAVQRASLKMLMRRQFERHGVSIPGFAENAVRTFADEYASREQIIAIAKVYKELIVRNRQARWYNQRFLIKHLGISLKRMCVPHGCNGVLLFARYFGVIEIFRGKKYGLAFLLDCLKARNTATELNAI